MDINDPRDIVSIDIDQLSVDDVSKFLKDIQKHIVYGTVEVNVRNEDSSITTYAIYHDSIKEIFNDI